MQTTCYMPWQRITQISFQMFQRSLRMTHENPQKDAKGQNISKHIKPINKQQCSPDHWNLLWPPLLSTQSMTACTPSERVSSSLRCHTAQQDPAGHVGPKGMSARKAKKAGNDCHKTPMPSTPSACTPHPASGVRMSNKGCSLQYDGTYRNLHRRATDVQGLAPTGKRSIVAHPWVGRNTTDVDSRYGVAMNGLCPSLSLIVLVTQKRKKDSRNARSPIKQLTSVSLTHPWQQKNQQTYLETHWETRTRMKNISLNVFKTTVNHNEKEWTYAFKHSEKNVKRKKSISKT